MGNNGGAGPSMISGESAPHGEEEDREMLENQDSADGAVEAQTPSGMIENQDSADGAREVQTPSGLDFASMTQAGALAHLGEGSLNMEDIQAGFEEIIRASSDHAKAVFITCPMSKDWAHPGEAMMALEAFLKDKLPPHLLAYIEKRVVNMGSQYTIQLSVTDDETTTGVRSLLENAIFATPIRAGDRSARIARIKAPKKEKMGYINVPIRRMNLREDENEMQADFSNGEEGLPNTLKAGILQTAFWERGHFVVLTGYHNPTLKGSTLPDNKRLIVKYVLHGDGHPTRSIPAQMTYWRPVAPVKRVASSASTPSATLTERFAARAAANKASASARTIDLTGTAAKGASGPSPFKRTSSDLVGPQPTMQRKIVNLYHADWKCEACGLTSHMAWHAATHDTAESGPARSCAQLEKAKAIYAKQIAGESSAEGTE
jgi:hypothetical protein